MLDKLNHTIRMAFGFSKMEANGLLILFPLMLGIIAGPYIFEHYIYEKHKNDINPEELVSLIDPPLVENESERVITEEVIQEFSVKPKSKPVEKKVFKKNYTYSPQISPFDLNLADSSQFKKIYGIGPVLSARIVKYRDMLGGFSNKAQLREVYGLQDSVLMALDSLTFIDQGFQLKAIAINALSAKELKKHPYISWKEANAIENYRFQHGQITSLEQLRTLHQLDTSKLIKLIPYLKF